MMEYPCPLHIHKLSLLTEALTQSYPQIGLKPPWVSSLTVLSGSSGKTGREGGEPMPVAHLNDTELFYVEVGEGLPCLVMHGGLGFDHSCLHPWLDPLGEEMNLVYYDHRGNGRSGRPSSDTITFEQLSADADALREHLGFEEV